MVTTIYGEVDGGGGLTSFQRSRNVAKCIHDIYHSHRRPKLLYSVSETKKVLFTRTVIVPMPIKVTIKFYHCANGDVGFDGRNGFQTHSALAQC